MPNQYSKSDKNILQREVEDYYHYKHRMVKKLNEVFGFSLDSIGQELGVSKQAIHSFLVRMNNKQIDK